jgi:hypothetical protein
MAPDQDIKHWLSWLRRDVGFDGWRFDFVKGYGGRHVREYVEATSPDLAVGEFWDDCAYTDSEMHHDQVGGAALFEGSMRCVCWLIAACQVGGVCCSESVAHSACLGWH